MRTYRVSVNDKEYTVEVDDLRATPVTVRVNGKPFRVVVSEQATVAQAVPSLEPETVLEECYVPVVSTTFVTGGAELAPEGGEAPLSPPASGSSAESVTAPMPGKIMDIVVRVGDRVQTGDTLCNLEAMKMKSPIRSTADGTIAQILISEGQNVNYGDVLFTLG